MAVKLAESESHRNRGQHGIALLEFMVAILIAAMVVAVSVGALSVTRRANEAGSANLTSSNSAFQTSGRFGEDVASVGPVTGVAQLVAAGQPGCGGTTSVIRLVGPRSDGTGVQVRSYSVKNSGPDRVLIRRSCSGNNLAAALASSPYSNNTLVQNLAPGSGPVTVGCDGGPITSACSLVEMTVKTATERAFTVRGTVVSSLTPVTTTTLKPAVAPVTGVCILDATATTWGSKLYFGIGDGDTHAGDVLMRTYQEGAVGSGYRYYSYLKFDLTKPCSSGSTWSRLPGGRSLTSATIYLTYKGTEGCCNSYAQHMLQPLDESAAANNWTEANLNGNNMPQGVRDGSEYRFDFSTDAMSSGVPAALTGQQLLNTVKEWYRPGGWANNGWLLRRSTGADAGGKKRLFASRFATDVNQRPRLAITWGP